MRDLEKHKIAKREWWLRNREISSERDKKNKIKMNRKAIDFVRKVKSTPCADCGVKYPYYVMDFDHRDRNNKHYAISSMLYNYGVDKIRIEVEKCDVVCANCHRERTWGGNSIVE